MYKNGVSTRATNTLNKKPDISNPENWFHSKISVTHNKNIIVKVSTN